MAIPNSELFAILKDIQNRLQYFDEAMAEVPALVSQAKVDLQQVKSEVSIMRSAITDHSYELKAYGERFRDLERNY